MTQLPMSTKTPNAMSYLQKATTPKFNAFDFSKPVTPVMNFGQGVSQANVTNFSDYKKTIPQTQPATKSSGFSLIPTANAMEEKDLIQSFLDDSTVDVQHRSTVFEMLKDNVPQNIIEDAIINKSGYKGIQPTQEQPGFLSKVGKGFTDISRNIYQGVEDYSADVINLGLGAFGKEPIKPLREQLIPTGEEYKGGLIKKSADIIGKRGGELGTILDESGVSQTKAEGVFQGVSKVGRGVLDIAGETFMSGLSTLTPDKQKEQITNLIKDVAETEGGEKAIEIAQTLSKKYNDFKQNNPRAGRNVDAVGTYIEGALELFGFGLGKKVITKGIDKTAELGKSIKTEGTQLLKKGGDIVDDIGEKIKTVKVNKAKNQIEKGEDILFEAVNPTTRENKAVLKKRVQDLLPYIESNPLKNSLEDVKARIDAVKNTAGKNMEDYETNIGVKGEVETAPIINKLKEKYQEKIGDSFINVDEAKMSEQLIETLKGFGNKVTDANIIKIRRAWDKIIEKNKGFMQSAEANSKGDIFSDANKYFREEIRKSNPEYAKYLNDYHKSTTLSDVLEATIQRRVGQQKGGFIKRGLEIGARVTGAGTGGLPGYLATEALIQGANVLSGPGFKLTRGANLLKKGKKTISSNNIKNGVDNNVNNIANDNSIGRMMDNEVSISKKSVLSDREKLLLKPKAEESKIPLKKAKIGTTKPPEEPPTGGVKLKPSDKPKPTENAKTKKVILKPTETAPTTSEKPKTDTTQVEIKKTSPKLKESKVEVKPVIESKKVEGDKLVDKIEKNNKRIDEINEELELRNYEYDKKHSYTKEVYSLPSLIKKLKLEKDKLKKENYDINSIINKNKIKDEIEYLKTLNKSDLVTTKDGYNLKVIKKDGEDNYLSVFNEDFIEKNGFKWNKGDEYNLHINEVYSRKSQLKPSPNISKQLSTLTKDNVDKITTYNDFEHYATTKGLSKQDIGDAGLHKKRRFSTDTMRDKVLNHQLEKDTQLINKRLELRKEYDRLIKLGKIKEVARTEKLISTANNSLNNTSKLAAQRVLMKRQLSKLTTSNVDDVVKGITSDVKLIPKVKAVIQKYIAEYGENIKNYLGLLADDIADIVGARAKLLGGEKAKLFDKSRWEQAKEMTKAGKSADEVYKRLAGETEARNVQTRLLKTPAERKILRPAKTEDVARDKQIVKMEGGKSMLTTKTDDLDFTDLKNVLNGDKGSSKIFSNYKGGLNISNNIEKTLGNKVMNEFGLNKNDIYIEKIYSEKPNKGYGNDILKSIIKYADENNKSILLKAQAEKRLSQKQLIEWYKRNGFKIMDNDFGKFFEIMYRKPAKTNLLPTNSKQVSKVSDDLISEAKKYKSADEFIKAQANTYHGTSQTFDKFSKEGLGRSTSTIAGKKGFWFTDSQEEALSYAKLSGKHMLKDEIKIEKEINKIIDKINAAEKKGDWDLADKLTGEIEILEQSSRAGGLEIVMPVKIDKSKLFKFNADGIFMNQGKIDEIITKAKKEGYDGVTFKNISDNPDNASIKTTQHIVFDVKNIKTVSELKRIYEQANKPKLLKKTK